MVLTKSVMRWFTNLQQTVDNIIKPNETFASVLYGIGLKGFATLFVLMVGSMGIGIYEVFYWLTRGVESIVNDERGATFFLGTCCRGWSLRKASYHKVLLRHVAHRRDAKDKSERRLSSP